MIKFFNYLQKNIASVYGQHNSLLKEVHGINKPAQFFKTGSMEKRQHELNRNKPMHVEKS